MIKNATLVRIEGVTVLENVYMSVLAVPVEFQITGKWCLHQDANLQFDAFRGDATLIAVKDSEDNDSCTFIFRSVGEPDFVDKSLAEMLEI